jgi:hypothetical protein
VSLQLAGVMALAAAVLAAGLAVGAAAAAPAAAEPAWVDATPLALREAPSGQAPVRGYLVTNTRVELVARGEPWCEVRHEAQRGFVVCRYLSTVPLSAGRLDAELAASAGTRTDLELLQKRFWIEPSLALLMRYGQALDERHVPGGVAHEVNERAPRPRRAEFEAMKQRLQAGWSVAGSVADTPRGEAADAASLAVLPRARPSLLKALPMAVLSELTPYNDVADSRRLAADTLPGVEGDPADWLARLAGQAAGVAPQLRVAEYGPPQAQKYGGYFGAWDVGGAHVVLPGDGLELLVLGDDGSAHRSRIRGFDSRENQPGIGCDFVGYFVLDRPAQPGFVALVRPTRAGVKSVRVLERRSLDNQAPWARVLLDRVNAQGEQARIVAEQPGRLLVLDLDEDGVPDMARLAVDVDGGDLMSGTASTTYFNLDGRWHEASRFLPTTCGC